MVFHALGYRIPAFAVVNVTEMWHGEMASKLSRVVYFFVNTALPKIAFMLSGIDMEFGIWPCIGTLDAIQPENSLIYCKKHAIPVKYGWLRCCI